MWFHLRHTQKARKHTMATKDTNTSIQVTKKNLFPYISGDGSLYFHIDKRHSEGVTFRWWCGRPHLRLVQQRMATMSGRPSLLVHDMLWNKTRKDGRNPCRWDGIASAGASHLTKNSTPEFFENYEKFHDHNTQNNKSHHNDQSIKKSPNKWLFDAGNRERTYTVSLLL